MNNDPNTNPELAKAMKVAEFKFGLIAPVLQGTYIEVSAAAYYKRVTAEKLTLPDGKTVKLSYKTLEKWTSEYKRFGFDALIPRGRSDCGTSRALSDEAIERIYTLKQMFPRMNATQIWNQLHKEGYLEEKTSVDSVRRFIRHHDLKGACIPNIKDRKAFEEDAFGKLWQADTKYLPAITEDGKTRTVYCVGILDDYSRMELKSELFYEDNAVNFQKVLKDSIAAYGTIPDKLMVDNGGPYANEQLSLICGELGIQLIHNKPRDAAAKAKRERAWRTLDSRLINQLDPSQIHSLAQFNDIYREYVRSYNTTKHTGIGCTPFERYQKTIDQVKRKPKSSEWLDACFLNRISRTVRLDSTITIDNVSYDVPMEFIRQKVEIRYMPSDMSTAYILYDDKKYPIRRTNKVENAHTKRNNPPMGLDYAKMGSDGK